MKFLTLIAALLVVAIFLICYGRLGTAQNSAVTNTPPSAPNVSLEASVDRPAGSGQKGGNNLPKKADQIFDLISQIESFISSPDQAEQQKVFTNGLLAALVELDPIAAAGFLDKIEAGPLREEYLIRVAQLWAGKDSAAALQWAANLTGEAERANAVRSVCLEIGQTNPAAAIQTIENLRLPEDRSTLENLVQMWAVQDISAATDWTLARPAGDERDNFLARLAYVMAEKSPREAADLVVKTIAPGDAQVEAAISIVHQWALRDWDSAREWVDRFPKGILRDRAHAEMAGAKKYRDSLNDSEATP
jgi:hypothetical protein